MFRSADPGLGPEQVGYSNYLHGRGHPTGRTIEEFFDDVGGWVDCLAEWLEVVSTQDANRLGPRREALVHGEGVELWTVDDGILSLPARPNRISITLADDQPISSVMWRRLVELASDRRSVPQCHRLLIDARAWVRRNEQRRAVIDAGTAAELALNRLFDEKLEPLEEGLRSAIKGEHRTLGRLIEVTADLLPIQREDLKHLVETRNGAVHRNKPVCDAPRAVATAAAIAQFIEPVA